MNNFGATIRTSSRTIGGLRTIERKEKRAIEHQIFLEISSSYLVFVLQSYSSSSSSSAVAGQGQNLDEASYNKLALMGMTRCGCLDAYFGFRIIDSLFGNPVGAVKGTIDPASCGAPARCSSQRILTRAARLRPAS